MMEEKKRNIIRTKRITEYCSCRGSAPHTKAYFTENSTASQQRWSYHISHIVAATLGAARCSVLVAGSEMINVRFSIVFHI